MPTKQYKIQTTSSRQFLVRKLDDGNYEIQLFWGRGNRTLATLIVEPREFKKFHNVAEGLMKK